MVNVQLDYIPKGKKRDGTVISPRHLTIHSTGNPTSTARNERNYLTNPTNTTYTGWHICVDELEAIMAIPLNERAWHAGDGANGNGNNKSIGLEICESGDRERTLQNAAYVAAYVLNLLGLGMDALRQHFDWSGKNCPRILRDTGRWEEFVQMVEKENQNMTPKSKDETVSSLIRNGITTLENREYWELVLSGDEIPRPEYIRALLDRYSQKLSEKSLHG